MQAMISTSLCKIGSTNKLMVMFDLLTTNNWLNDFPDHALMTVSNRKENGVSILSVYHTVFLGWKDKLTLYSINSIDSES